jgi:site-specific DNA-methyltransferase (adenine-specific)
MSDLYSNAYNPDVLSCLANLSSDEVFTPPHIVNQMLDMLPQELFRDKNTKFLDPATKSGVFLREIAKRLLEGLKDEIPNLQDRIDHVFQNQLYGIAVTEMTSLLSRRSVYCSKYPNSKYSISLFNNPEGNIRYKNSNHKWIKGKCEHCGASAKELNRGSELDSHAYEFIHEIEIKELEKMKFDVIIGNPPYQLNTNGSVESQATPIYNKFVEQSKKLKPKYLVMITPARWFNGGFGLDRFREEMLSEQKIKVIHDFFDSSECFPGVQIKGGVAYFLWDRDYKGDCEVYSHLEGKVSSVFRPLLEKNINTFIRWSDAVSIIHKVKSFKERSFSSLVSPRDPFGLNYYENKREIMFKKIYKDKSKDRLIIYSQGWIKNGIGYTDESFVTTRKDSINKWKIYISKAYGASESFPHQIINKPFIGEPGTICNMTYLIIGDFDSKTQSENVITYMQTKFFRFLVSLLKNTQNAYRQVYDFVPIQDFSTKWSDDKLYEKYSLNTNEINFIEKMIKPMDLSEIEDIE